MLARHASGALPFVLAALVLGCGGDDAQSKQSCRESLDAWCARGDCDGFRTFDGVLRDPPPTLTVSECGDRRKLTVGMSLVHWEYVYDRKTGQLIGARGASDEGDTCPDGFSGGDARVEGCTTCLLAGYPLGKIEACDVPLARPYVEACMANPPPVMNQCIACGCASCYPVLLQCGALEPDASVAGASDCETSAQRCVYDHCSGCEPSSE